MNHPVTLKALARKYAYEAKDDNGKITCYKFTPEELDAVVEATHQAAIEECVLVAEGMKKDRWESGRVDMTYSRNVAYNEAITDLSTTLKADK